MKKEQLTFDEIISAVRGLSVKEAKTISDLNFSISVLKIKIQQMEEEKRRRKNEDRS